MLFLAFLKFGLQRYQDAVNWQVGSLKNFGLLTPVMSRNLAEIKDSD